jgi:hypothetical protein
MDDNSTTQDISTAEALERIDPHKPLDLKEYFRFLKSDLDEYLPFYQKLTVETASKLRRQLMSMRTGTHSVVPLICAGGSKCPIAKAHKCPFNIYDANGEIDLAASVYPLLLPCPIEKDILYSRIEGYAIEYNADVDSPSDIALLSKLAQLDIMDMRCDVQLAAGDRFGQGQDLLSSHVASINPVTGDTYLDIKVHPLIELKEKIHKQRMEILDVMLGTRKAKAKAKKDAGEQEQTSDLSITIRDLQDKVSRVHQVQSRLDAIDAEYEEE